tara:strand:- start:8201 stop:9775 length:1575 start_codon:yes stop_codon:yes gene_type:complete
MSYRNPKIIDDKSGLIVSQAINQATASLGQGIVAYGAEQKKRREKEALKQKKDAQTIISLANMSSENAALFNNGLKDMSENVRGILITRNERTLKRINEIYIEQQVNNNASPALSKELGFLKGQIAQGNDLAKSIFQTSGQLSDILQDPNAFSDRRKFFKADENGSTEKSEAMIYGFGGRDGYEGSMVEDENGQLYAQVYVKESGKTFKIEATEFGQISDDFILNKKTNASVEQVEFTQNEFFKDGELIPGLIKDVEPFSEIKNGKRITGTRQYLNEGEVDDIRELSVENTASKIVGLNGSLQMQGLYIEDLGLDPEKYQEMDTEGRAEYIRDRSGQIFKNNSSLKKNEKGYYFDTNVKSYNLPKPTKSTAKTSATDLDIIENFNTEGEIELKDFGLNDNTRLIYGNSMKEPEDISFDNNVITVTFKKPEGKKGTSGYEPGVLKTFDVSTNEGRSEIIKRLGLNKDSQFLLKKLLKTKIEKNIKKNNSSEDNNETNEGSNSSNTGVMNYGDYKNIIGSPGAVNS